MSCYANACLRSHPCATNAQCEATWHACNPTHKATPNSHWACPICWQGWTRVAGPRLWVRNPPSLPSAVQDWSEEEGELTYVQMETADA